MDFHLYGEPQSTFSVSIQRSSDSLWYNQQSSGFTNYTSRSLLAMEEELVGYYHLNLDTNNVNVWSYQDYYTEYQKTAYPISVTYLQSGSGQFGQYVNHAFTYIPPTGIATVEVPGPTVYVEVPADTEVRYIELPVNVYINGAAPVEPEKPFFGPNKTQKIRFFNGRTVDTFEAK